ARYRRAKINAPTTAAAITFPHWRGRPGTTSEYTIATASKDVTATGDDGIDELYQVWIVVTPYGRGRVNSSRSPYVSKKIVPPTKKLPRNANRCRHLRKTSSATTRPSASTVTVQPEPIWLIALIVLVSQPVRSRAIWRNTPVSRRSVKRITGVDTSA